MIYLQNMRGILEMHLYVRIIPTCKKISTKQQNILKYLLSNLLLNEKNELHNRSLHISGLWSEEKVDIERSLSEKTKDFSVKTMIHIHRLFEEYGYEEVFGRGTIMELLELKASGASRLLSNLVQADIIEPVSGYGKGRYKFKKQ